MRMEVAKTICDISDGFRAVGDSGYTDHVFDICADSVDAYWLVTGRLARLEFDPRTTLKFSEKVYELANAVDTAYEVGMTYFKLEQYGDAVKWLKKTEKTTHRTRM